MESLHVSTDTTGQEAYGERGGRSTVLMIVAVILAVSVTGGLFAGYMFLKHRHAAEVNAERRAQAALANKTAARRPAGPPELQVFVDDAMLRGSQTVIGGTLLNISQGALSDLSVELELRMRKGGGTETRTVATEPASLQPNQQARYSLKVPSQDYSSARLLRIRSGARSEEIAFKSVPGAQRPPEVIKPEVKTVIVKQPPQKRGNGEEFINTPDNPSRIP